MKVNQEYLSEFCRTFNVLQKGYLTGINKSKINYTFGIPIEKLENITTKKTLKEKINEYFTINSEVEKDLAFEVENTYNNLYPTKS